ncbi:MAG: hypothetical protein ACFFDP_08200 [Promethearchaeota archaeon]
MKILRTAIILFVIIILLWVASGLVTYFLLPSWQTRGTFGDMFGVVNALFSGLALAGVILAILLQRKELELQREELKLTREELQRTADAQEKSEKALKEQAEALYYTIQLNSLNALLTACNERLEQTRGGLSQGVIEERKKLNTERQKYLAQIKVLLELSEIRPQRKGEG